MSQLTLHEQTLILKGERQDLLTRRQRLRYEMDVLAKAIIDLFYPLDTDCSYTEKIDLVKLDVYVEDLKTKRERYHGEIQKRLLEVEAKLKDLEP